jgi:6-phosphogluconolactonase
MRPVAEVRRSPRLEQLEGSAWDRMAGQIIVERICEVLRDRECCDVVLTGGRTAERVYQDLARRNALPEGPVRYFFGDERCVTPDDAESNYGLVMRTLFADGLPAGSTIVRMHGEWSDGNASAREYERAFPDVVDVLLLSVGPDGHIASLFPHDPVLDESERTVVSVIGTKAPVRRLSITPRVVREARSVYLLAAGEEKGRVLAAALREPEDYASLPVRLTVGRDWLLDVAAARALG